MKNNMSDEEKVGTSLLVWLTTVPFFYVALTGGGPKRNIYIFFEHLTNLSHLSELTSNQLFEEFYWPLSVWISILVLFAMNIGWLLDKRIHPIIVCIGSICGIPLSVLAIPLTFGLGLFLITAIWFACSLAMWHLDRKSKNI